MDDQRTDRESGVTHHTDAAKRSLLQTFAIVLAIVLLVIVVIYGPLLAIYAEFKLFGSTHVADFLNAIGVLDVLEFIYDSTPGIRN